MIVVEMGHTVCYWKCGIEVHDAGKYKHNRNCHFPPVSTREDYDVRACWWRLTRNHANDVTSPCARPFPLSSRCTERREHFPGLSRNSTALCEEWQRRRVQALGTTELCKQRQRRRVQERPTTLPAYMVSRPILQVSTMGPCHVQTNSIVREPTAISPLTLHCCIKFVTVDFGSQGSLFSETAWWHVVTLEQFENFKMASKIAAITYKWP